MKNFLKIAFVVLIAAMLAPALFANAASYPYTVSYNGTSITLTGDTTLTCTGNAPPYGIAFNNPNGSAVISWNGAGITCDGSTQHANGGNNGWGMSAIGSNLANFGDVQNTLYTLYGDGDFNYYLDVSNTVILVPANFSFITHYTLTSTGYSSLQLSTSTAPSLVAILNGFFYDPGFYAVMGLVIGIPFAFWLMKYLLDLFYEAQRENERMAKKGAIREEKREKDFEDTLSGNKARKESAFVSPEDYSIIPKSRIKRRGKKHRW